MKKILNCFLCLLILILISCANNGNNSNDFNEGNGNNSFRNLRAIHNFSNYTGIGVGIPNNSTNRSARATLPDDELKLIGQKGDGSIEVVSFDDETGTEQVQTYTLSNYTNSENFIFLGFSDYKVSYITTNSLYSYTINYLLDKKTGKLYSLNFESSTSVIGPEYGGKVIVRTSIDGIKGIYFCSIENEQLKIELIADYETLPVDGRFGVDRYGNFLIDENYILTKTGKLKRVSGVLQLCMNGIFYNSYDPNNITQCIDENGDYINTSFVPEVYPNREGIFNTSNKDQEYYVWDINYYGGETTDGGTHPKKISIGKISFLDEAKIKFNYEIIASSPYIYKGIVPNYMFDTGKVMYIADDLSIVTILDVLKQSYTDIIFLSDVLRVKSITHDKFGNIVISYVSNDLNTINYYIDTDGNYSTTFTEPEYIIKYIASIN